ncbi:hypothetical protein GLOIN_2v1472818 [Rhizophagus clarus]|uniref:Tyr recombinase domain-containing protein n=1 Tax=Rhizophagus clarus TaxID=94130 RepID=A0A8H3M5Q8_9GLOM|nr:hypothetical protein GLOIN_2v1472818 [Rhizophagus clarus]
MHLAPLSFGESPFLFKDQVNSRFFLLFKGLGDPKKSDGLSAKEIKQILDHPYMDINSNESLRVFFWLCLLCGLRGGNVCRKDLNQHQNGDCYWFKNKPTVYVKLRKMMNDIATNTGINLDNRCLITNHSCRRTAIQILKNNGLSNSDLQSFSDH